MSTPSGNLITRNYANFRGVDFSDRLDEINLYRSPDALNIWKNYKNENGKCIETRPDVELLAEFSDTIFGLFFYGSGVLVHSGDKLYADNTEVYNGVAEHKSRFFVFNDKIYFMDGTNYLVSDNGTSWSEVEGFIPTTSISRSPLGGGVIYEDVNLLSPYKKNTFCADGTAEYHIDSKNIDGEVRCWIADELGNLVETNDFTVDNAEGVITFNTAPDKPLTDGQDNVVIQYKKDTGVGSTIKNCTMVEVFDNRVFASGNPDLPNRLWHCSLNDASYWSDLDYYDEGTIDSSIKSLVVGNNALWVLKAPSKSNTTIFYHNPTIDSTYGKIYPSTHSSISTGCITTGINFNDTICFYSENGLEAISGDITTEQVVGHKSSLVDSRLLNEEYFDEMQLIEWQGYLLTIMGGKIYLADSRQYSQVNDHYEYEWYYFDIDKHVDCAAILNNQSNDTRIKTGDLILCTTETVKEDGNEVEKYRVYALNNYSSDREVEAYWTTLADEFNYPQYQKITNKKGCVADVEGEAVDVYARTDNKTFDFIKRFKKIPKGYIVPRIKKKKWKSIQLMFKSTKPFRLYSSTLESYIGSYIKR